MRKLEKSELKRVYGADRGGVTHTHLATGDTPADAFSSAATNQSGGVISDPAGD